MKQTNSIKKWYISVIFSTLLLLIIIGGITIYIDPLFHYHAPCQYLEYPISDERYQNDGIVRHFNYNTIITGTSMVENFRTSECDRLMDEAGVISVKVPFAGAPYKEINENLKRAFEANQDIKLVIRCLDYTNLYEDKDTVYHGVEDYGYKYPYFLTNNNIFDDVEYLFNKEILLQKTLGVLKYTQKGGKTTTFDEYMYWSDDFEYGKETVLNSYINGQKVEGTKREVSEEELEVVKENISQNITNLVDCYPEVKFCLFFPPYSICYWDVLNQKGQIEWRIGIEQYAIEELLKHPNIYLYSFSTEYDLICDLNNYRDKYHYGGWVNSQILKWISNGEHRLSLNNYIEYINEIREFYQSYDYTNLRK